MKGSSGEGKQKGKLHVLCCTRLMHNHIECFCNICWVFSQSSKSSSIQHISTSECQTIKTVFFGGAMKLLSCKQHLWHGGVNFCMILQATPVKFTYTYACMYSVWKRCICCITHQGTFALFDILNSTTWLVSIQNQNSILPLNWIFDFIQTKKNKKQIQIEIRNLLFNKSISVEKLSNLYPSDLFWCFRPTNKWLFDHLQQIKFAVDMMYAMCIVLLWIGLHFALCNTAPSIPVEMIIFPFNWIRKLLMLLRVFVCLCTNYLI